MRFFNLNNKQILRWTINRKWSSASQIRSSQQIRQDFLDYFIRNHNHKFVKSSSVIPFCDPTLSFTNAGMNQFKNILMGNQVPAHKRVTNSQKCIRVGGKHNDLSIVGSDSYHHTFFEMLGNWSFGDYFKKEACGMAWELLTKVYGIEPARLYVTYFKGNPELNLPADLECRDIWRELGVPADRIIGFGKENFWEMGTSGPCGGCTEIHVDHLPSYKTLNRAKDVNQDLSSLTELWNLVFIEYFRNPNGSIVKLPEKHVDTGMGFERLVAFLQGKNSNYDTDLFQPIFRRIQEVTGASGYSGTFDTSNLDTAYRILADHTRMVAVSLADGMFPEENQKLRRILRRCILISEKDFKNENLIHELIPIVSQILGETYPELVNKQDLILEILKYEQELYKSLRESMSKEIKSLLVAKPHLAELDVFEHPGFLKGYAELSQMKGNRMDGELAFRLYSTHGLNLEFQEKLAELEGLSIDKPGFERKLQESKKSFTVNSDMEGNVRVIDQLQIPATVNYPKFNYIYDPAERVYKMEPIGAKVLAIIGSGKEIFDTGGIKGKVQVIFDKSPFYVESGGQESDRGWVLKDGMEIEVNRLWARKHFIIHEIEVHGKCFLKRGDTVLLHVDTVNRSKIIRNHSGTHLLNAAVRHLTNSPIFQKSSLVNSDGLKLELAILGKKLSLQDLEILENLLRKNIKEKPLDASVKIINSLELSEEENVLMVPGETYPENGIRLVSFGNQESEIHSKELCCGTHAFNSRELWDFTFLNVKSTGKSSYLFTGMTGQEAEEALEAGNELLNDLVLLKDQVKTENIKNVLRKIQESKSRLSGGEKIAFVKKQGCLEVLEEVNEIIKSENRSALSELLDIEMKELVSKNTDSFIIHNLSCSDLMKSVSLQKATRYVSDRPVMLFSFTEEMIKARCCVPKNFVTSKFTAEKWLNEAALAFRGQVAPPKGQNPTEVCNMKPKKISVTIVDEKIQEAIERSRKFAEDFLRS